MVYSDAVPVHIELGQLIFTVVITHVGRAVEEQGPSTHPEPEVIFVLWMNLQITSFIGIAFEPPR